jgi:platelet-activating factor acetylhydrolase IB subunit alpha
VSCAIFVQDSQFILSSSRDKTIKLWEISTSFCKRTYQGHEDWVRQVVATKDSKTFASCSND